MKTYFETSRKESGFTLIELLTVIVIIGILAAIAIPVFSSQRARAQDTQTISDVRNIAMAAESYMADPGNTYNNVIKGNIDYTSSKNVTWAISGSSTLGGYCIAAKNTAGKKYTTDIAALTYDSKTGGLGRTGGACVAGNMPVLTAVFDWGPVASQP